jgi:hypothetical protein
VEQIVGKTAAEIVLTREDLYTRVWSTPMQKLAAEFGLSDVGLAKICKKHKIPRPSRGYWAKVERGKKVDQWPLVPVNDESLRCIRLRNSEPTTERKAQPPLAADPAIEALIAVELATENRIQALTDLRGADPLITATREALSTREGDEYGRVSRRYDFTGVCFDVCVAKQNIHRSLLLLHSLVRAFRSRGFTIGEDGARTKQPYFEVLGRQFKVSVWEPSKRRKRELAKQDREELSRYPWRGRDYEHVPSGVLELHLDRGSYSSCARITDTKRAPLEQRLNELIVCMLKTVDRERIQADVQQREALEAEKRRRAAVEQEIIGRSDSVREDRLLNVVPRWENACRIKRYIKAVRREAIRRFGCIDDESEVECWLHWAEQYLQTVDPLSTDRDLPTFTLSAQELEQLRQECESDWCNWSHSFRPRKPR